MKVIDIKQFEKKKKLKIRNWTKKIWKNFSQKEYGSLPRTDRIATICLKHYNLNS